MQTLENQMRLYLRFFTLLGWFPFCICDKELIPSGFLKFYGFVIMLVQVTISGLVMSTELGGEGFVVFILRCLPAVGGLLIVATIMIPICDSKLISDMYERFNKVDKYFAELGIALKEEDNIYPPFFIFVGYFAFTGTIIGLEFVFPYWVKNIGYYAWMFFWCTITMTLVMVSCSTYSHLLTSRFKVVNKELERTKVGLKLKTATAAAATAPTPNNVVYDVHYISNCYETHEREIFPPHGNRVHHLKKSIKKCQTPVNEMVSKIKKLQRSHFELCEICESLGGMFTPSIVLSVVFTGTELLITAYTGLGMIIYSPEIGALELGTCIKWILVDLIRLVCILTAFTTVEKIGNTTPSHVHGLLLETEDSEAQKELIKFSQQLSHQKISFSTSGFFSLDMSLLVSMAGAITTYLVILLQFSPNTGTSNNQSCTITTTTVAPTGT